MGRPGWGHKMSFKDRVILISFVLLASILFYLILPKTLFQDPVSTVVYDRNGELLGARIAKDGQWRFPGLDSLPEKYAISVIEFEDRYFNYHPGINPVSIGRALIQNLEAGEVVSGGSTITMQVFRMSRKNKPRTIPQKLIEGILALRLELTATKPEILKKYANNAPFGGNVVGLEAAAWRYFGTNPHNLTWSESALLAVLPNSPSMIHPGKNRIALKIKRDKLLKRLYTEGYIDEITYELGLEEPLPEKPLQLPNITPHITDRIMIEGKQQRYNTSIDRQLQESANELIKVRQEALSANEIHNMACMIMDVETGSVLAYVGNSMQGQGQNHAGEVDIIQAGRSTGSILKPFLFAGMLDNGDILQTSLIPDVPIRYNGYAPKNYDRGYLGAVPAYKALQRSLNIPSVILLKRYGVDPFLGLLRNVGFSTFTYSHEHYGLTLILGGAETTLWELCGMYGSMARVLNHYTESNGNYFASDYRMPELSMKAGKASPGSPQEEGALSASSIYLTFESLLQVNRPEELSLWYLMSSSRKIAWKTGTSYGYRDAWAVGVTTGYIVAVWAGNADGEGRPGLSGLTSAAPLMFDLFSILPETAWFEAPLDDLSEALICRKSGYLAGPLCEELDTMLVVPKGKKSKICPFHHQLHLDQSGRYRVDGDCYPVSSMKNKTWFVLPPLMEWYYKKTNPTYLEIPPVMIGCKDEGIQEMEIIYPEWDSHLVIPRELDGTKGKVVLEVSHRESSVKVFWHIDEVFVGTTSTIHQLALDIAPGIHKLTVVDEMGNTEIVQFEVLR